MRLLFGSPGSGKTTKVLQEFCDAARSGEARLVVPTATMAEHLQHILARRGEPVPPSWITTLSRFASSLAPDIEIADSSTLALLVSRELENFPQLYPLLRGAPGLPAAIASSIEELANSGCGALQWSSLASLDHRFDPLFGQLYDAIEQALRRAGFCLRADLIQRAAARVRERQLRIPKIWFDGFTLFSRTELFLLDALSRNCELTVTLPKWPGAAAVEGELRRFGARTEHLSVCRPQPAINYIQVVSREREAGEIALQILDEHRRGRPWREMAVIIRSEENYLALLERTFGRLGIPARAYFGRSVLREPAGVFFQRFAAAVTSGWDGETTLALLRHPLCRAASGVQGETWLTALENLPFQDLNSLRRNIGAAADVLAYFESWPHDRVTPDEWARRLPHVAALLDPPPADGSLTGAQLQDFRLRSSVFRAITDAAAALSPLLGCEPLSFSAFWLRLSTALAEARVYPHDPRRDVVHILDVQEARQWELPVVFVCGLLEGEFPIRSLPDPILSEPIRLALREHGFPVRIRSEREEEERFHFEIASTRATGRLVFSWPERNEKGESNLRSFLLDVSDPDRAPERRIFIRPSRPAQPAPRPALQSDEALRAVRAIRSSVRATAVESFLQCPFQFFARSILELRSLPPLPSERFNAPFLGSLAHKILVEWHQRGGSVEALADEVFDRELRRNGLRETHQTLLSRAAMKRCLAAYAASEIATASEQIELETDLELHVSGVEIRGRADRIDISSDGKCSVYDFKYSSAQSVQRQRAISVQVELYAEALSRGRNLQPAACAYVALKDKARLVSSAGSQQTLEESIAAALEKTRTAIERFQSGHIAVSPAVEDLCGYCEFRDACRWQEEAAAQVAAGGSQES